jgi:hypothetical protein
MHDWISGRRGRDRVFDGTIGSLIRFYQVEPNSPYHRLAPSSRHPYDAYIQMIVKTVGARRIDALDGRDLSRWHAEWSRPIEENGRPRIAAAHMAMTVLKTALSFGICRLPGCANLKLILQQQRFPAPSPRLEAPTAAEVVAARKAAHELTAVRGRDATMGCHRSMGALFAQDALTDHRWRLEMDRPHVAD